MSERSEVQIEATADKTTPPFTVATDPVTGVPFLLLDPELKIREHLCNVVKCYDAASFVAAVDALKGKNRLVELRSDGEFFYQGDLGAGCLNAVRFMLTPAPTAGILCLNRDGYEFSQPGLVRWNAQWPGTLVPQDDNPEAVWEQVAAYSAKGVTQVNVIHGDDRISVSVERDDGAGSTRIPRLWTATSPVYEGHAPHTVTLRLDVGHPQADQKTGTVSGQLTFVFSLWQPAASEVEAEAMEGAAQRMSEALPDLTVIRGLIGYQPSQGAGRRDTRGADDR